MDPDVTPKPAKTKPSIKSLLTPLKNLLTPFKNLLTPVRNLLTPLKNLLTPLAKLPIPKKFVIPAIAGAVLLIAGGVAFGVLHARPKHAGAPPAKAVASAPVTSTAEHSAPSTAEHSAPSTAEHSAPSTTEQSASSTAGGSSACSGVVRDIYRQTVAEDPSVTLAEARSEVLGSGISCAPDPEIAAELKDLSPACRDMVQYTFLGVRDGHTSIKVIDVREKVVQKSVACEPDRRSNIAAVAPHKVK